MAICSGLIAETSLAVTELGLFTSRVGTAIGMVAVGVVTGTSLVVGAGVIIGAVVSEPPSPPLLLPPPPVLGAADGAVNVKVTDLLPASYMADCAALA